MAVFVIGVIDSIQDEAGFIAYQQKAGPTLAPFGGQVIAGGSNIEVADGDFSPAGMVVIAFETMANAKAWYNGPAYSNARSDRFNSATSSMIFLQPG